jgi:hypothetical protein
VYPYRWGGWQRTNAASSQHHDVAALVLCTPTNSGNSSITNDASRGIEENLRRNEPFVHEVIRLFGHGAIKLIIGRRFPTFERVLDLWIPMSRNMFALDERKQKHSF